MSKALFEEQLDAHWGQFHDGVDWRRFVAAGGSCLHEKTVERSEMVHCSVDWMDEVTTICKQCGGIQGKTLSL